MTLDTDPVCLAARRLSGVWLNRGALMIAAAALLASEDLARAKVTAR